MSGAMFNFFHGVAEVLTPTLKTSQFAQKGVLTPEEFVKAGDQLVFKCPTWSWEKGEPGKQRNYLPPDKQYLQTRRVPCMRRATDLQYSGVETVVEGTGGADDGWVSTHANRSTGGDHDDDIPDMGGEITATAISSSSSSTAAAPEPSNTSGVVEADEGTLEVPKAATSNIVRTRTYDLTITYDKYYQTPRVWLFGYDEADRPLTPEQVFEDISQDHANKTVTIEAHPHLSVSYASIHPCKHAPVMKKILDMMTSDGKDFRADQYIFVFLKFISAVIPTIEYDYTTSAGA
jgi:ubiquitin-like-conjugating enzyme ATG3